MSKSKLEARFLHGWESYADPSLPLPVEEHTFHPTRKWRWDYAWPDLLIAVDIQGGTFMRGRHSRGAGQTGDHEKMNAATLLGWRILQFSTVDLTLKALPHTIAMVQELVCKYAQPQITNDYPEVITDNSVLANQYNPGEHEYATPRRRPIPQKGSRRPRR